MLEVNLKGLVTSWHSERTMWKPCDNTTVTGINPLKGDELTFTLDNSSTHTVSYTELLLWYINKQTQQE